MCVNVCVARVTAIVWRGTGGAGHPLWLCWAEFEPTSLGQQFRAAHASIPSPSRTLGVRAWRPHPGTTSPAPTLALHLNSRAAAWSDGSLGRGQRVPGVTSASLGSPQVPFSLPPRPLTGQVIVGVEDVLHDVCGYVHVCIREHT